ncbi:hypothetical protein RQM59_11135 [Flavobacteriaceae bacterium S356]|uniref:tRNA_anti-like n=1 Tax=Asprobacillus argus TaxID=3076534 RepID=A0ABU3LH77_9FLAO|nr:hypothetical protein [Flavobacteriaceae bacterium S356]
MSKKRNIVLLVLSALLIVFCIYLNSKLTAETYIDIENVSTELNITSNKLVANFMDNEERADSMFSGKIVEITGRVKEVTFLNNRNTVILYGQNTASGIICDFDTNQLEEIKNLSKNQKITIKGVCKGFLKDVVILNCLLMNTNLNE